MRAWVEVWARAGSGEFAGRAGDDWRQYIIWRVILASAVGTMIEWYDFYIFGSLAAVLSPKFYPPGNETFAYIAYLATFAVGFLVRPFGALFFGRIGDVVGRKYAFLATLSIMGGATAVIGLLPSFKTAGWFAPITLLLIRVLQGLALGGEYGGATVYVAEHVPDGKRGFYTSFIQITATLGLFVSLLVILATQSSMSKEEFADWGWRIPFLISIVLVSVSLYIRLKMKESPIFAQIKSAGMTSVQPLKDAFGQWDESEARADFVVWRDGRARRDLVHGAILCAVLFADGAEGKSEDVEHHRGGGAAAGDAVFHGVWRDFRSRRAQVDHDGGVFAGDRDVHSDLQVDAERPLEIMWWG